jgi:hypothetical protein
MPPHLLDLGIASRPIQTVVIDRHVTNNSDHPAAIQDSPATQDTMIQHKQRATDRSKRSVARAV